MPAEGSLESLTLEPHMRCGLQEGLELFCSWLDHLSKNTKNTTQRRHEGRTSHVARGAKRTAANQSNKSGVAAGWTNDGKYSYTFKTPQAPAAVAVWLT
ncbi:hypothetical protein E4U51_002220 [Claviceps purpurea]|nr:hypothetical protein E4U51_002220 [Claviceps purpurea]